MAENQSSTQPNMTGILLTNFGGYEAMKVKNDLPKPSPGPDEVLINIKACGMNFSDLYVRQGIFTFKNIQPPFILGSEGAGIISEIGQNVKNLKVGDRVMCWNFKYGIWSEFVAIKSSYCCLIPENMSFEQAAAIPANYITAFFVVLDFGNLRSGQSILIQSAAGGVGWAATQLAKSVGNVTIFGTASSSKHDAIKENGVTHAIDYRSADFTEEVKKITPSGVDVILDCLSGYDFIRSQTILKNMGRLVHIGISNMITGERKNLWNIFKVWFQTKNISILNLIQRNIAVCGLNVANLHEYDPDKFIYALKQILNLFKEEKIKPRIDSVWSFEQFSDEDESPNKKLKLNSGSGLLGMLPPPKYSAAMSKSNPLVPHVLTKKKPSPAAPVIKKVSTPVNPCSPSMNDELPLNKTCETFSNNSEVKENSEEQASASYDFFSLSSSNHIKQSSVDTSVPNSSNISDAAYQNTAPDFNHKLDQQQVIKNPPANQTDVSDSCVPDDYANSEYSALNQPESNLQNENFISVEDNKEDNILADEGFFRLQGKKKKQGIEDINIIDVKVDDELPSKSEWLTKSLTEEKKQVHSRRKDHMPTQQQKRKHQITYLAFQAKERELDLKNQWAQNRLTRRETQSKYGF